MFSNDYGTPLLSADSTPESTGLLSSHGEWASNDEIEYMQPNVQANQDLITNSPAYSGVVSAEMRCMENVINQKNDQMSKEVPYYQEYSPAAAIFTSDGQNLQQGFTLEYIDFPEQLYNVLVTVNLDAYESNGKDIYELARSRTGDYNMYHLIVEVVFKDELVFKHCTRAFKIVVRAKRSHSGSLTSSLIQARKVVAEHIATKTLEIDGLKMGKTITTSNGDIAYHYPLRDESQRFGEGEVVGLFPDESQTNGTYVIDKLSSKKSNDAALKGVITRSHYLEAQVPKIGESTETICMLGIVPVQVIGSVLHNEAIYASPYHPGCGISKHNFDISLINESSFIGYACSSRETNDEKSMGFVQAGVFVLESAGKYMLDQQLREVDEIFYGRIDKVKEDDRKPKKWFIAHFFSPWRKCFTESGGHGKRANAKRSLNQFTEGRTFDTVRSR